jgi:hypothetical protein
LRSSWLGRARRKVIDAHRERRDVARADRLLFQTEVPSWEALSQPGRSWPAFLVAGLNGLLLFNRGEFSQVLKGDFFGLTRQDGRYFGYQRLTHGGRIISFRIENDSVRDLETFIPSLPRNVHQIDFIDKRLFVCDPSHNRILVFDQNGVKVTEIFPAGKLSQGRASPNYAHFNSVYAFDDAVYIVAHNYTQHSKRKSEIFVLDRRTLALRERDADIGDSAHNIVMVDGLRLHCDSLSGVLCADGRPVFSTGILTRGLAANQDVIVLGGSEYSPRSDRAQRDGFIYIFNREFELEERFLLKKVGQVHEIRLMGPDFGLSNDASQTT